MDEEKRQRYQKRRLTKQEISTRVLTIVPDPSLVQGFLNQPVDTRLINAVLTDMEMRYGMETPAVCVEDRAHELLDEIKRELNREKIHLLIGSCRDSVLASIIRPFGLSSSKDQDQDGGNVTTVHNFVEGVAATREDAAKLQDYQDKFDRREYENRDFVKKRKTLLQTDGPLLDSYTSSELPKDGRSQLDHVVSAHEIDQNPKAHLFLSKEERAQMANANSNLVMTHHSINQSKSDLPLSEWMDKPTQEGSTKAEKYNVNREAATRIDETARKDMNHKLRQAQMKKQGGEVLKTGGSEGVRMGLRQSFGVLLREFATAVFDEAIDIFNQGFKNGRVDVSFFSVLRERMQRVAARVMSRWKDVVAAFRDGAISGFFSNLVTFLINSLTTTTARAVRVIREGFFSLLRALKVVVFPPEGLTRIAAAHEATKLLGAALVTTGGILIEEAVDKFVQSVPVLGQIAGIVTPVVLGMITGITSSLVVFLIDKVDLFGVVREERHRHVIARLDSMVDGLVERAQASYSVFELPVVEF
ncbi:hypothetical protein LLE49_26850 [Alicyclobacillus tolerans]|uniref:hypothetical protein n=1 Tax=Alicyclobacillus tolerans TaxID=90970 RepID=UPI001F1CB9C4|nr:hypothetical protein [Alicyclobacillus tolerans]MCF8568344.1 hypothetical protein [Alicyclobacillus tolerans]